MKNQLLEKFHNSLSKINWKKLGLTALYIALGLVSGGILTLLAGVVFVGHPTMPARQNPANMVITRSFFWAPASPFTPFEVEDAGKNNGLRR